MTVKTILTHELRVRTQEHIMTHVSVAVAKEGPSTPKECYRNSVLCLLSAKRLAMCECYYVEGFAVLEDYRQLQVEHGWIMTEDGMIIDPTWNETNDLLHDRLTYFAAAAYTFEEIVDDVFAQHGITLPLFERPRRAKEVNGKLFARTLLEDYKSEGLYSAVFLSDQHEILERLHEIGYPVGRCHEIIQHVLPDFNNVCYYEDESQIERATLEIHGT